MRRAVCGLLVLPFLLVALLPQGYMPALQDGGGFTVTLCTTDGLKTVTLDADGNEIPADPSGQGDGAGDHCLFAGLVSLALAQGTPELPDFARGGLPGAVLAGTGPMRAAVTGRLGARAPPLGI
ncbi:MAG: hypothetical protein Tsb0019_25170 [Roseibium sp.]